MMEQNERGVLLCVYIQPGAHKNEIIGPHDGALKIKIKSPPVDGKANATLLAYLKELTGLPKKNIELIAGDKSRKKKILFSAIKTEELKRKLGIS